MNVKVWICDDAVLCVSTVLEHNAFLCYLIFVFCYSMCLYLYMHGIPFCSYLTYLHLCVLLCICVYDSYTHSAAQNNPKAPSRFLLCVSVWTCACLESVCFLSLPFLESYPLLTTLVAFRSH